MDAGLFGNRLAPHEAYRFARGEEVVSSPGQAARLSRPLDWPVVADHSDGMGLIGDLKAVNPAVVAFEQGASWCEGLTAGDDASVAAALNLIGNFSQRTVDPDLMALFPPAPSFTRTCRKRWSRTPRRSMILAVSPPSSGLNGPR